MKSRILSAARLSFPLASAIAALAALAALAAIPSAKAATYYWDTNGTSSTLGGFALGNVAGTWGTNTFQGTVPSGILDGTAATAGTATTNADTIYFGTNNLALGSTASTIGIVGTNVTINTIVFGTGQGSQAVTLSGGGGAITLASTKATITVNNSSNTVGAVIAGTAGMVKGGAGTLVLTGANTYTGTTTLSGGGTLQVGNGISGNLFNATPSALTFNAGGGVLNVQSGGAGSTQAMGALNFSTTGEGEGTVQSTYGTSGNAAVSFTSLAARGPGASGNFVTSGGTNGSTNKITITGAVTGTLLDKGIFFGGSSYAASDTGGFVRAYGSGDANFASIAAGADMGTRATTDNVSLTGSLTTQGATAVNTIKMDANSIAMTGTSLVLQTNGLLSSGSATIGGGTTPRLQTTAFSGEMVIRVNGSSDQLTISSIIQNNGITSLTKSGAGTLTLSGANTYTGITTINAGALAVSGGSAIVDTGAVLLANAAGASLLLNNNETIGNLSGGGFSGGNVNVGANTLTIANANRQTFGGKLIGSGGVTISSGTLTLSNKNTFAGTISLSGTSQLTLTYGSDGAASTPTISSGGNISMAGGTSLAMNPTAQVAAGVAVGALGGSAAVGNVVSNPIIVTSGTATIRQIVAGGPRFLWSGGVTGGTSGAQTLSILQGAGGGNCERTTITVSGIIQNGSGGTLGVNADFRSASTNGQGAFICLSGQNTFTGPIVVSNTYGLLDNGGYKGAWFVIGGEITSSFGDRTIAPGTGYLGGGNFANTISLATGTILNYMSSANQTLGGVISGTGRILKEGSGTLTLSANNTYTGTTTVASGMLTLASTGGLKFVVTNTTANKVTGTGTATINGTFTLDTSAVTVTSGSWPLVDATTKSFGGTFGLTGFTGPFGNDYTRNVGGQTWTFNKATGVLSLTTNAIITAFGIPGSTGVINQTNKTIALTVPYTPWGISGLATLAPTFTLPSGTCNQTSGSPPSPTFASANPATYTVTDGATVNNYAVTLTVAPSNTASVMQTCVFGALGQAAINEAGGTASLSVPPSQALTSLAPTFTISANATINPASGSTQDFTNPVVYRVTAENGTTFKDYTVSVQSYATWTYSGSIFILTDSTGANLPASATETNFPLLVRFNSVSFPFGQAAADGRDIRFSTPAGTALPYEIEQWDSINGRAAVWVKIPTITGDARQEIKMYWGKAGAPIESNGPAVFNSANGYCSVMHLNGNVLDATGSISPVNGGATPTTAVIGSTAMNLASGNISATNITNFPSGTNPSSAGEVWIRARQIKSGQCLPLAWGNNSNMQIGFVGSSPFLPTPLTCRGPATVSGSTALAANQWYHVVYSNSNGTGTLYINGVLDATASGGSLSITNPQGMSLGAAGGDADVDEARISSVARSAAWVKMAYENQKPLQTLLGGIVPSGSGFSVSPTSVTMNESTSTTLTAQAGGAQKIYWIYKKNGQETVLATDQLTFTYTAPRITGNDLATIQFKAVFAGGTQTIDVPLTVLDTVPDPVFTLVPSTTSWDGRSTMTVTANISNLAAMQSAGFGTLNYKWDVSGVTVAKQTSNGTLTLTRSQGSGPLNVTLTIDNGGALVKKSVVITVQEPDSDAWAQRTPDANEKPVNKQFFARDPGTGLGTIHYRGTEGGATDVYLKVYTTDTGADVLYATHRKTLAGGAYSFAAPIAAGKVTYKVTYGTTSGGNDSAPLATVSDLVCGDAFIIEGQSNALATDNSAPNDTTTTNPWVRTYGLTSGWGYAISKGNDLQLGLWGWYLANRLVVNYNMPVCIINGAVGGTRIDQHRPNPAGRSLPGAGNVYSIYANLYNRVVGAKLTHGIRGLLWHQGEQNQGSGGIDPDYDYKFYQQYFVDISAAWKQDFPNLRNYYFFQIWPAACGDQSRNDQLREVQRTLSRLYSNMKIMSTHGIVPGSGCHYVPAGYQVFSDLIGPLVEQDVYGVMPSAKLTAPNLQWAYFSTPAKNEIALVFDQNIAWNPGAPTMLFLANAAGVTSGTVSSGSATGNTIKLQVSGAASAATITYLKGLVSWQQPNILVGANGIAALTFADVPIGTLTPYETWAMGTFANAFTDAAATSDPDGDGKTNQEEFAFGLDPTTGASVNPITQQLAGGVFKYTRTKNSGFIYKVYYSTNLSGWTLDAAATQTPAAAVAGVETVTVTLAAATPLDGKLFVRVEATPAP